MNNTEKNLARKQYNKRYGTTARLWVYTIAGLLLIIVVALIIGSLM